MKIDLDKFFAFITIAGLSGCIMFGLLINRYDFTFNTITWEQYYKMTELLCTLLVAPIVVPLFKSLVDILETRRADKSDS